ncbi:MAG TPA: hypothetical protein VGG33_15545 [Polyangia bacterium]
MHQIQKHRVRQPHGARPSSRARIPAFALAALSLAGCRISSGGLTGTVTTSDAGDAAPAIPMGPSLARPDAAVDTVMPTPSPTVDAAVMPPPSRPDAAAVTPPTVDAAPPAVDLAPARPDAVAMVETGPTPPPVMPPPSADPCAPPATMIVPTEVRLRGIETAQDFTFNANGLLVLDLSGNVSLVDNTGRADVLARNLVFRVGRLRGLTDGDLLVLDSSRNQLSRVDPELRRPERFPMYVRQPLQLAPAGSTTPSLFYVTNEQGQIFRANADTGDLALLIDLGNVNFGGIAVDGARRKLYVGVLGNGGALHSLDIGSGGQLTNFVRVADSVPSPTALALDSCGGIYVGGSPGGAIRRRAPSGEVSVVARLDAREVVALEFGSGRQGWSEQALFALDGQTGSLFELRVRP